MDRIHRLGMEDGVETNHVELTEGTVDFTVDNRVREKAQRYRNVFSAINDIATMALPAGHDYGEVIAEDDIAALFAHLRGLDS